MANSGRKYERWETGETQCEIHHGYNVIISLCCYYLISAVILGVGIWALADDDVFKLLHVASVDTSDGLVKAAAITFVVLGAIVFITGFFGCCGAIRESPCMLMTVSIFVHNVRGHFCVKFAI